MKPNDYQAPIFASAAREPDSEPGGSFCNRYLAISLNVAPDWKRIRLKKL